MKLHEYPNEFNMLIPIVAEYMHLPESSIERFSEDIDLTFLGMELSDKICDKTIKKIEEVMTDTASTEKIDAERSNRSKSMYVWFGNKDNKVKLEIGSSVRPDPYSLMKMKN